MTKFSDNNATVATVAAAGERKEAIIDHLLGDESLIDISCKDGGGAGKNALVEVLEHQVHTQADVTGVH